MAGKKHFVLALLLALVMCHCVVTAAEAMDTTQWFNPVLLMTKNGSGEYAEEFGSIEVVMQVTPNALNGSYEYVYWVTNNTTTMMSDFYFTCLGVTDPKSFMTDGYQVLSGTRVEEYGLVKFSAGPGVAGWGDFTTDDDTVPLVCNVSEGCLSTRLWWSALGDNEGLDVGDSLGFSFASIYPPGVAADNIPVGLAARMFNGEAYGPDPTQLPECSSVFLALTGLGCVGAIKQRFRRN